MFSTIDTTSNSDVYPQYPNQTVDGSVHSVNYLGGPFIISDTDAPDFLALLQGTLIAQDPFGNNIDFSPFRTTGTCSSLTSNHYVNIHRAQTGFSTTIATYFTTTPARLALLANDVTHVSGTTAPQGVTNGIIDVYLANAGLTFPTAAGCRPADTTSATTPFVPAARARGRSTTTSISSTSPRTCRRTSISTATPRTR